MSDTYRLVFRGEVLEGQHPAVVRRKLGQLLSLDDAKLDRLFSGQAVVVKEAADKDYAARLQAAFHKAGARLRVAASASAAADPGPTDPGPAEEQPEAAPAGLDVQVLPVGSDVLREDERTRWEPREIDTSHLELADSSLPLADPGPPPPPAPDTSRLTLADPD